MLYYAILSAAPSELLGLPLGVLLSGRLSKARVLYIYIYIYIYMYICNMCVSVCVRNIYIYIYIYIYVIHIYADIIIIYHVLVLPSVLCILLLHVLPDTILRSASKSSCLSWSKHKCGVVFQRWNQHLQCILISTPTEPSFDYHQPTHQTFIIIILNMLVDMLFANIYYILKLVKATYMFAFQKFTLIFLSSRPWGFESLHVYMSWDKCWIYHGLTHNPTYLGVGFETLIWNYANWNDENWP